MEEVADDVDAIAATIASQDIRTSRVCAELRMVKTGSSRICFCVFATRNGKWDGSSNDFSPFQDMVWTVSMVEL